MVALYLASQAYRDFFSSAKGLEKPCSYGLLSCSPYIFSHSELVEFLGRHSMFLISLTSWSFYCISCLVLIVWFAKTAFKVWHHSSWLLVNHMKNAMVWKHCSQWPSPLESWLQQSHDVHLAEHGEMNPKNKFRWEVAISWYFKVSFSLAFYKLLAHFLIVPVSSATLPLVLTLNMVPLGSTINF